jgi:hypothetical protein
MKNKRKTYKLLIIIGLAAATLGILLNFFTLDNIYKKAANPGQCNNSDCSFSRDQANVKIGNYLLFGGLGLSLIATAALVKSKQ